MEGEGEWFFGAPNGRRRKENLFMKILGNRNVVLISGILTFLIFGLFYAFSVFVLPLEQEFGWTRAETAVTYSLSMMFMCIGIIANGLISARWSSRHSVFIGITLVVTGFLACGAINSLFTLYFFYGVLVGTGIGLCYNAWLSTVLSWFPDRSGFASGMLLAGFGLGGLLFGSVITYLINSPLGWRKTFLLLGILVLAESLLTLRILLQKLPVVNVEKRQSTDASVAASVSCTPKQMLRDSRFYMFAFWSFLLAVCVQGIIGQAAPLVSETGASAQVAALAVGMLSVGNGVGRPIFGAVCDRFGHARLMALLSSGFIVLAVCYSLTYRQYSTPIVMILLALCGLFYGGVTVVSPTFTSRSFGLEHFKTNFGIITVTSIPGTLASSSIGAIKTSTGTYLVFFYIMVALTALSLLIALWLRRMEERTGTVNT